MFEELYLYSLHPKDLLSKQATQSEDVNVWKRGAEDVLPLVACGSALQLSLYLPVHFSNLSLTRQNLDSGLTGQLRSLLAFLVCCRVGDSES